MANAVHQIMASSSATLALAKPKARDRSRQHSVRLYSAQGEPLFLYSDKAKTPFDAVAQARAKYADVLEAIFRAQGLTRADASPVLRAVDSEVLENASSNTWRVSSCASYEAAGHPRAQRARLEQGIAGEIVTSLALIDRNCITALQQGYGLRLGMWLSPVGQHRLIEIDSAWLVTTGSDTIRIPHANNIVRSLMRLVTLRTLSPYHQTESPNYHPFGGPTYRVVENSKTLLARAYAVGPAPSEVLISWLEGEGFAEAAKKYRESF